MFEDFLCLFLMGMKNVYIIMCYSFFHEYHFVLNMKHEIKVVREDTN